MTTLVGTFDFTLDSAREASQPPEERGTDRGDVRMLVTAKDTGVTTDHHFSHLPDVLRPGDLLVVNNSATVPAAVWMDRMVVHFSGQLPDGDWLVELRERVGRHHRPSDAGSPGESLPLPGGPTLKLVRRYTGRLWVSRVNASVPIYLKEYGRPVRYSYVDHDWPLEAYQTVFATQPGSAEMPSAGRPITADLVAGLVARGISIAPITLHTGVASPEVDEPPYPEYFEVPAHTARAINLAHHTGSRVVAVGTTVVRAVESAASGGALAPAQGWTQHVITPDNGVHFVDGLLTGLHEPRSSHLSMLSAFADPAALATAYRTAIDEGYLWHEFGDVHLIV